MIRSKLMLCADNVVRDAETNNISVFNIFEEFPLEALPALIPRFAILNILERDDDDDDEISCTLEMNLSGADIFTQQFDISFQDKNRTRSIVHIGGLPLSRPGTLKVALRLGESLLGEYRIGVTSRQPSIATSQG